MSEMPAMSDTTTNTLPTPANDDPWSAASTPTETAAPAADPWGATYLYKNPGRNNAPDIFSLGADGKAGGDGDNADIYN